MEKNTKSKKKNSLDFSKEQYIKWYKDMLVMRKVEERVGHLYICLLYTSPSPRDNR